MHSLAHDINNQGVVVGSSYGETGLFAFRWTEEAGMQILGDLPGGSQESIARAVNDRGEIVGNGRTDESYSKAVLWDKDGEIRDLGALRPGDISDAGHINNRGQVLGWSLEASGGTALEYVPFLWTHALGMIDLHLLLDDACGDRRLSGFMTGGINDQGEILLKGARGEQRAHLANSGHTCC